MKKQTESWIIFLFLKKNLFFLKIRAILTSFLAGFWDSIRNISVIFYIDGEISKKQYKVDAKKSNKEVRFVLMFIICLDIFLHWFCDFLPGILRLLEEFFRFMFKFPVPYMVLNTVFTFQCCLLNGGIFLGGMLFFDYLLMPILRTIVAYFLGNDSSHIWSSFLSPTLSIIFGSIWVLPLFVLSKIINTFWFQDIADAAYEVISNPSLILVGLT